MGLMRILLALAVVIDHASPFGGIALPEGRVSVQIFYIISGFYMTMILREKYTGKGSYWLFISNRLLRLYPIYWFVILLTLAISVAAKLALNNWGALTPYFSASFPIAWTSKFYFTVANMFIIGQDYSTFLTLDKSTGQLLFTSNYHLFQEPHVYKFMLVPQAWTLGVEISFYLLAPMIVRMSTKIICMFLMVSVVLRIILYQGFNLNHTPWTYCFFPTEMALFILGILAYTGLKTLQKKYPFILNPALSKVITFLVLMLLLTYQEWKVILPFANCAIYLLITGSLPFIFHCTKQLSIDNKIGEFSYPVYISHVTIIWIVKASLPQPIVHQWLGEIALLLTLCFSYFLLKVISDPIDQIRQMRLKHKRT